MLAEVLDEAALPEVVVLAEVLPVDSAADLVDLNAVQGLVLRVVVLAGPAEVRHQKADPDLVLHQAVKEISVPGNLPN